MQHRCVDCGRIFQTGFHPFCDSCKGLVDVEYENCDTPLAESSNPYIRFASLLPIDGTRHTMPATGFTPAIHAQRLGRMLGMDALFLKDETALETRTTKDRMAAVALAYLHDRGVRIFAASSTGNSSTSLAHRIRAYPDMHLFLFTAENFVPRVQFAEHSQVTHFGMRGASFVEASDYAARYAKTHGLTAESGFFNPGRREGLKLAFLEASEQIAADIGWYVQAVSSAMGVYGAHKAATELRRRQRIGRPPALLCVQQQSCAPMVTAFADGSETIRPADRVANPRGIADAILRGDPSKAYPYIRRIVIESGGTFVAVDEAAIREARRLVEEMEGLNPCFSASAALAGLIRRSRRNKALRDSVVLVNLTGGDRHDAPASSKVAWIDKIDGVWTAPPPGAFI